MRSVLNFMCLLPFAMLTCSKLCTKWIVQTLLYVVYICL